MMGTSFLSYSQLPTGDGLSVLLSPPLEGEKVAVRCQFLIGADGAGSKVRQVAGIRMEGDGNIQRLINVHFVSLELGRAMVARGRAAMLYFVFNADTVAVIVAHRLQQGEFVAQIPFYPPQQSLSDFTPQVSECAIRHGPR